MGVLQLAEAHAGGLPYGSIVIVPERLEQRSKDRRVLSSPSAQAAACRTLSVLIIPERSGATGSRARDSSTCEGPGHSLAHASVFIITEGLHNGSLLGVIRRCRASAVPAALQRLVAKGLYQQGMDMPRRTVVA